MKRFLELSSTRHVSEIVEELLRYVQSLESGYSNKIYKLQLLNQKTLRAVKSERSRNVNRIVEKNELEQIFVDAVEEVRKKII